MSGLVKQDINFIEYALWIQDETIANKSESGFTWYDRDGYTYRTGYKPPTKADFIFLLYFLMQSQQNEWKEEITFTKYETIKNCGVTPSSFQYERIEDSLKRWSMVKLEFKGVFYDGEKYQTLVFGVIDEYSIKEDSKEIKINFSPKWLQRIKESNYFKYINFSQIKTLRSPLVIRLYEILIKSFQNRSTWEIDAMKLAQKIPMNEKYPADVIPKIKAALNRINKHTNLKIKLTIRRPQRGKAILVFEKFTEEEAKKLLPAAGLPEDNNFKNLITLLPKEHQDKKTILEAVAKAYKKHGFDYTARNIRYTNRNCKGNYRAYLTKALKEDWGLALKEDEEVKQKIIDKQQEQKRQEREALERQKEMRCKVQDYMKNLSSEKLELIREEAVGRLDEKMKKYAEEYGTYDTIIEITMNQIVEERLTAAR